MEEVQFYFVVFWLETFCLPSNLSHVPILFLCVIISHHEPQGYLNDLTGPETSGFFRVYFQPRHYHMSLSHSEEVP